MHKPARKAARSRGSTDRFDVRQLKEAASGHELSILRDVAGISEDRLDGKHHSCPHPGCPDQGGSDRFRLIDADAGAVFCNQCFADNNGDFVAAVMWMHGVGFREALQLIGEYLGIAPQKRMKGIPDPAASLRFSDWNDQLAAMACLHRETIRPHVLAASGARLATYRNVPVVALPVRVDPATPEKSVGFVLLHGMGGKGRIPRFDRQGNVSGHTKAKLATARSRGGSGRSRR